MVVKISILILKSYDFAIIRLWSRLRNYRRQLSYCFVWDLWV